MLRLSGINKQRVDPSTEPGTYIFDRISKDTRTQHKNTLCRYFLFSKSTFHHACEGLYRTASDLQPRSRGPIGEGIKRNITTAPE